MLVEAAGLRVGFPAVLAPEVALPGVDHHVLFQPRSIREALAANITRQHGKASGSLKKRRKQKNKIAIEKEREEGTVQRQERRTRTTVRT